LELLHQAGHTDFRDARGPMGFSQRQAGGKFTRDEAEAFITRLQEAGPVPDEPVAPERPTRPITPARSLLRVTDRQLADELRRRGWTVIEP